MRCTRKTLAGSIALPASLALVGLALAQEPSYQTAELVLEQPRPGSVSPLRIDIDYVDPANPSGKPPAVAQVVETLPAGSRIDTSVPEACTATDAQLATQGASACQPDSRVGGGEVDLDTGSGVLSFNVTQFNNHGELILLFEQKGGGIRTPSRAKVQGDRPEGPTIVATVPPIPGGPPDGFTAIKRGRLRLDAVTRAGKTYVTTPRSCPAEGYWTSRLDFTYRNGSKQFVTSRSTCAGGQDEPMDLAPPRIVLKGLRAGCASHAFRLKIRIRDDSRLRRAAVRADGRRIRTSRRKRFSVGVPAGTLRLIVVARDEHGNRARKRVRLGRCAS